jgi:hypothetical protein
MAVIPVPRSYSEILGDMIDAFLSRFGLRSLKAGTPVLSILESVAQSQLRSSEDIFTLLEAQSLDNASGDALDRIGADESTPRIQQNPASGTVTISDTSFTKIASKIFQGTPAPIVGTTAINIVDASSFPSTGSVYLGRETQQFEGPIAYTSKVNNGTYWTLNLASSTLRFHNQGESVVVAQGGDRQVSAGTIIQTPQGNTSAAIQFKTLFSATIPDGETSISGVIVVAIRPGISGNVAAKAINGWQNGTGPFNGAAVSNPLPFTNGTSVEDDDSYRERIRQARQSRTKGTALAIQTNAVGVSSNDENKRVLSASVVTREGYPTTLYIDDGTGYEMRASGVAIESLIDSALGGEQYFKVAQRPIAKAFVESTIEAPFTLTSGMKLGFAIDNVITEHTFSADEFRNINNATAYEMVASINADVDLNWQARTANGGTKVQVTAKTDTNESIQLTVIEDGVDANPFIGFPAGRVDTMRLYLDDQLLSKDGRTATIISQPTSLWSALTGQQSLVIIVDGVQLSYNNVQFNKFSDQDFIDAHTGYTTLGKNSLEAWAAVFNLRIPGITATVEAGLIVLSSNRAHSTNGRVSVVSGDLVTNHMFLAGNSLGANSDYTLNRNTGELALSTPMSIGQKLTAGSTQTRAFLKSPTINTLNLVAQANLWLAVDANAVVVPTGVTAATSLTFTSTATGFGFREKCTAGSAVFQNVQEGDWVVFWDPTISASLFGSYRVTAVDPGFTFFYFEKATSYAAGPLTLSQAGIMFGRTATDNQLQKRSVASGALYTASSLATALDATLSGAFASTYRTNILRVRTNTFNDVNGDIALVAADVNGQVLGVPVASAIKNLTGHMAAIESGNSEIGTPDFFANRIVSAASQTAVTIERIPTGRPTSDSELYVLRADQTSLVALTGNRWSSQFGFRTSLSAVAVNASNWDLTLRAGPEQTWLPLDRLMFARPYMLSFDDQFTALIDGDTNLKRYTIPMWRTIKATSSTYGATNDFTDADNGNASIAAAFGLGYDFNDFAVYMAARGKTDSASGTKAVLWRYYRLGPDGNGARVTYSNPLAANAAVSLRIDDVNSSTVDVRVSLASGALRTTSNVRPSTFLGAVIPTASSGMGNVTYVIGLGISSGTRIANSATLTVSLPAGATAHGIPNGAKIYVNSTDANYPSGAWTITAVAATTITYTDTSVSVAAFAGTGTVSYDSVGEATLTGSGVIVSDYMYRGPTNPAMYISAVNAQNFSGKVPYGGAPFTVIQWGITPITDPSLFQIYANANQTAATIIAAVNALNNPIVKPTIISTGLGVIDRSLDESLGVADSFTTLVDGLNFVKTTTSPGSPSGNYTLVFKDAIDASLVTNSDWVNEVVKIVPRTTKNVVNWFNTLGVTGLSSTAEIVASSSASKVQISSLTPGSNGSVQIQGGTSNAAVASVVGSASLTTGGMAVSVPAANITGMHAGVYVSVENSNTMPKAGVFDQLTNLTSLSVDGVFTFNGAGTPVVTLHGSVSNAGYKFEKQGRYVCIIETGLGTNTTNFTSVQEGDWVSISLPATPAGGIPVVASGNIGIFRVIRKLQPYWTVGTGAIWIENPTFVAQNVGECDVVYLAPNSVLPGDTIHISTSLWNAANLGTWTVTTVPGVKVGGSTFTFTVDISQKVPIAVGAVGALGAANANLVQDIEGIPAKFVKKITTICQNSLSQTLADVKFDTTPGSDTMNATAGTLLRALDKLDFSTELAQGIDGYQYNTGLIRAVNKVEYGDPADPATYPGVVAAGANINIEGAPIKRIQVGIALRIRSGANTTFISQSAKSAVAAIINSTGVGNQIALIDIAKAAKVPGVISVIMLNPQMITGSDLISVQPYETPLVLDLDQDVLISFVGD